MRVDYEITSEGLVFTADEETRQEIQELFDAGKGFYDREGEILEHSICNGLSYVQPEDIGALTDATILSDDSPDDDGNFHPDAQFFWDCNYQVTDWTETLKETGTFTFTKGD